MGGEGGWQSERLMCAAVWLVMAHDRTKDEDTDVIVTSVILLHHFPVDRTSLWPHHAVQQCINLWIICNEMSYINVCGL